MALKHVRKTYEQLGHSDPLYAVLSMDYAQGNRWDPEVFFATGKKEIAAALASLEALDIPLAKGRALDFGCGVGRLAQALAAHFDEVVGVDISSSMLSVAAQFNRAGSRCRYLHNTSDDLQQLETASFDFVYSNIALQHSPPEATRRYIVEFFRVLRPGGVAVFQVPSGPRHASGSLGAMLYSFKRGPLRRLWKRLRGKAPVEIHYINQHEVLELIAQAGGRLIEARQDGSVRRSRVSMFYTAVRD